MNLVQSFTAFFMEVGFPLAMRLLPVLGSLVGPGALLNIACAFTGMAFFIALLEAVTISVRILSGTLPEDPCKRRWMVLLEIAAFSCTAAMGEWAMCACWGLIVVVTIFRIAEDYRAAEIRAEVERQSLSSQKMPVVSIGSKAVNPQHN